MRIKVEACWGGNTCYYFRLTLPCGAREHVHGEYWSRATAREALDMLVSLYGLRRSAIRFDHH